MRGMKTSLILSVVGDVVAAGAVLLFMEKPAAYFIALALLLVPGGLFLFLRPFLQGAALEQSGQPAAATVLEMWDTGWTVNENQHVGLRLQVRPAGDPPYEAKTKMVLPRLLVGQIRPGTVLQVRYDPKNPQRVVVDTGADVATPAAAGSSRAAERLAELEELRRRDLVTEDEYERKRREILEQL